VHIIQAEGMNDMQHESYSVSRVQAIIAELETVELVGILVTDGVRKLALLTRKKIQRQKRLLSETDQLLRNSRDFVSRPQELIQLADLELQPRKGNGAA
jgi:hypothetical protein